MMLEKDIEKIANLAKLHLKSEEIPFYVKEIEAMLDFAKNIKIDENDEIINNRAPLDFNNMREDTVSESFECSEILSNAKDTEDGFFKLRKRA